MDVEDRPVDTPLLFRKKGQSGWSSQWEKRINSNPSSNLIKYGSWYTSEAILEWFLEWLPELSNVTLENSSLGY